jgi:plastocyanin
MQRPSIHLQPRATIGGLMAVALLTVAACGGTSSQAPGSAVPSAAPSAAASVEPSAAPSAAQPSAPAASGLTVTIEGNVLPAVTAKVGETITWQNLDAVPHTVTPDDGSFSGTVAAGSTFSHAFDAAGSYPYHCNIHPSMTGTITITD